MLSALLITLREGLEAALIIGIVLAYLVLIMASYFYPKLSKEGGDKNRAARVTTALREYQG